MQAFHDLRVRFRVISREIRTRALIPRANLHKTFFFQFYYVEVEIRAETEAVKFNLAGQTFKLDLKIKSTTCTKGRSHFEIRSDEQLANFCNHNQCNLALVINCLHFSSAHFHESIVNNQVFVDSLSSTVVTPLSMAVFQN